MKRLLLLLLAVSQIAWAGPAGAASQETYPVIAPETVPSLIECVRNIPSLDFCGERVPLDNPDVRERMERELLLMIWDRPQTIMWLKRSGRYFPFIESMLRQSAMPDDLKYIAIIESSLLPHVGSNKGALGFWQFIKDTGDRHGLSIDDGIDERRNIHASTRAALDYLIRLHGMFNSWALACAAYNMGENGLREHIRAQEVTDYYNLYLPLETQRYVIRAAAAKLIMQNPARYGFRLTRDDYWKPLEFDRVELALPVRTHLLTIAKAAGTTIKALKDLNPEIRGYTLEAGRATILLPRGGRAGFEERLAAMLTQSAPGPAESSVYVVRAGDTLTGIAARHGVSMTQLLEWNRGRPNRGIQPGDKLVIMSR